MNTKPSQSHFRPIGFGVVLCLAVISLARAETPPSALSRPSGPDKVRIIVNENMAGELGQPTTPAKPVAPIATPPAGKGNPVRAEIAAADLKSYTRTSSKTFSISVMNLTAAKMDVVVKTEVLAKDEAGKHEVVTEKTLENKLTLLPGRADSFTTDPVEFTHTAAHRGAAPKGGNGGGKKGGPIAPMEPASGHAYFGYKVEVLQGSDVVGTTASEIH